MDSGDQRCDQSSGQMIWPRTIAESWRLCGTKYTMRMVGWKGGLVPVRYGSCPRAQVLNVKPWHVISLLNPLISHCYIGICISSDATGVLSSRIISILNTRIPQSEPITMAYEIVRRDWSQTCALRSIGICISSDATGVLSSRIISILNTRIAQSEDRKSVV